MLYIAHNSENSPIGGKKLAEILNIPARYLEPYLQNLGRGGILTSSRGAKGGYKLARAEHDITVSEICEIALGGYDFDKESKRDNSKISSIIINPLFQKAKYNFWESLQNTSLADLTREIRSHKLQNILDIAQNDENTIINFVI